MRDLDEVDEELRLVSVVRRAIVSERGHPSTEAADRPLDKRIHITHQEN